MSDLFKGSTGLLVAGAMGLVLSDIIPTPGDALYFYRNQKDTEAFVKNEITAKQLLIRESVGYYAYNSGWWLIVSLISLNVKGSLKTKLKVMGLLSGLGVVGAVVWGNYQRNKKLSAELYAQKNGYVPADLDKAIKDGQKK
jgi:hypothetical protein